jgi:hypothetical protein
MGLETLELVRGFERLAAVLIGGLAIYLGYRLFSLAPKEKVATGTVTLPGGIKVNLSRVGPGAFFALVGGILIGNSLLSPVHKEVETTTPKGVRHKLIFNGFGDDGLNIDSSEPTP